jgi:hypothetical protein
LKLDASFCSHGLDSDCCWNKAFCFSLQTILGATIIDQSINQWDGSLVTGSNCKYYEYLD